MFNTPITQDPTGHADGMDFTIFGNEFFVLGSSGNITGLYNHPGLTVWVSQDDSTFYQLASSNGADDFAPTQGDGNAFQPLNPALTLSNFVGDTQAQALALYAGSAGGASYSLASAEDANGNSVDLPSISYVEVEGSSGYGYVDAVSRVESVPETASTGIELLGAGLWLMFRWLKGRRRNGAILAGLLLSAGLLFNSDTACAQDFTLSNIRYWAGSGVNESALVIAWNDGKAPDPLVWGYRWNPPASGDAAPTVYDMLQAIQTADPRLSTTAHPAYDDPSTGDYALYSVFYDLTGKGGTPVVGTPEDLGGTENGYAPYAGDHYEEGWYTGFWGELEGIGNPYDGGSWTSAYPQVQGLAIDTLSDDSWFGLSYSQDETSYTIPDPGTPTPAEATAVPEATNMFALGLAITGVLFCRMRARQGSSLVPRRLADGGGAAQPAGDG